VRISVIGCGYVGLVTGGCLAEIGHDVVCADRDERIVQALNAGQLPIYEPHLGAIVERARRAGRLMFTANSAEAVNSCEATFLCVGVPQLENGDADLSGIDRVARLIATESRSSKLVIERSTVPVQTGQQLKSLLATYCRKSRLSFRVAANPLFLREGTAIGDFLHPDRILIGVEDLISEQQLREIYRPVIEHQFNCPVHSPACPPVEPPQVLVTSIQSAELIKHASNSFLALKISYANIIGDLCERLDGNVAEVTRAMGLDPRIGSQFLQAGLGFGGFRLPRDIRALCRLAERAGIDFGLLKEAERINRQRIDHFLEKIRRALWVIKDKRIGLLGLAYKPNTDDIRFSPAIELIKRLLAEGAQVQAYDPEAMGKARAIYSQIGYGADPYEVAQAADALLITTEWQQFRLLDWARIRNLMARPLVLDGSNLLAPEEMKSLDFEYHCIGRPD